MAKFWRESLGLRERLLAPLLRSAVPVRPIYGASDLNSGRHLMDHYRALSPEEDIVCLEGKGIGPKSKQP